MLRIIQLSKLPRSTFVWLTLLYRDECWGVFDQDDRFLCDPDQLDLQPAPHVWWWQIEELLGVELAADLKILGITDHWIRLQGNIPDQEGCADICAGSEGLGVGVGLVIPEQLGEAARCVHWQDGGTLGVQDQRGTGVGGLQLDWSAQQRRTV